MFLVNLSSALFLLLFLGVSSETSEDDLRMFSRSYNPGVLQDSINMSKRSYSPYAFRSKYDQMLNKLLVEAGQRFIQKQLIENTQEALKKQTFFGNNNIAMKPINNPRRGFGISYGRG